MLDRAVVDFFLATSAGRAVNCVILVLRLVARVGVVVPPRWLPVWHGDGGTTPEQVEMLLIAMERNLGRPGSGWFVAVTLLSVMRWRRMQ